MNPRAIYPGTFDPITNGHLDLIERGAHLFSELVIGVAESVAKRPFFSQETRIELIREAVSHIPNVSVKGFNGLLITFAKEVDAHVILRGVRAVSDFEYEFELAGMNKKLSPNIETIFLTPSESVLFISSSLVREVAVLGGDIDAFVPSHVKQAFSQKIKKT